MYPSKSTPPSALPVQQVTSLYDLANLCNVIQSLPNPNNELVNGIDNLQTVIGRILSNLRTDAPAIDYSSN